MRNTGSSQIFVHQLRALHSSKLENQSLPAQTYAVKMKVNLDVPPLPTEMLN